MAGQRLSVSFSSLASFGFGRQEGASKQPQAICKPFVRHLTATLKLEIEKNLI